MKRYFVEVNECAAFATTQGVDWWLLFRQRFNGTDRITDVPPFNPQGNRCQVACDDKEHADWLARHMVEHGGLPSSAVKVKSVWTEVAA